MTIVIGADDDDIEEDEKTTEAEMDSYVNSYNPTSNYGESDWLKVGEFIGYYITYIYFDFEDEPDDWEEAEISLDFFSISETIEVNMYLVSSSWEELSITWIDRPTEGVLIEKFTVAEEKIYKSDISDLVEDLLDDDEEGFSICLNTSYTSTGHIYIHSEEGAYDDDEAPLLIWTYNILPEVEFDIPLIMTIISIVAGIGIAVLLSVLYFTRWRKKEPGKPMTPKPTVVEPVQPIPREPVAQFCSYCGLKVDMSKKYCSHCGTKID
ncbi:MAG: DNRLRE domain-containing protein [Promethearchaeota archaeon]